MYSQGIPLSLAKGRDNEVPATQEQQKMVCYLDDGTLLISESHKSHSQVLAYTHRLNHLKRHYKIEYVSLKQVADAYNQTGRSRAGTGNDSTMQEYARQLFTAARDHHAADIHIRVNYDSTDICFGINNEIHFYREEERAFGHQLCQAIYTGMASSQSKPTFETAPLDATVSDPRKLPKGVHAMRIATTPKAGGLLMVLRLLYDDTESDNEGERAEPNVRNDLAKLGMSPAHVKVIKYAAQFPYGINFFCGPTGSGKSTSLKTLLSAQQYETNQREHLITLESPIEYPIKGAQQTPVEESNEGMAAAISRLVRLAPTVAMIAEIRNEPTAKAAIRLAVTGHQVWTTMHTNNWIATFLRLQDYNIEYSLLYNSQVINSITCQRLVKTLCPCCRQKFDPKNPDYDEDVVAQIEEVFHGQEIYVHGPGCDACGKRAFKGRALVCENLKTDDKLMSILRRDELVDAYNYWVNSMSGRPMIDHAIDKVRSGIVDPFEATRKIGPLNYSHEALKEISLHKAG